MYCTFCASFSTVFFWIQMNMADIDDCTTIDRIKRCVQFSFADIWIQIEYIVHRNKRTIFTKLYEPYIHSLQFNTASEGTLPNGALVQTDVNQDASQNFALMNIACALLYCIPQRYGTEHSNKFCLGSNILNIKYQKWGMRYARIYVYCLYFIFYMYTRHIALSALL